MTSATPSSEKTYFNLHTQGFGYLSRVRTVTPKKGEPFLACDINALNGPSDSPDYRRFDVTVTGAEAQHLVRRCENAANGDRKVLIGFRLGDLWTDPFTYMSGEKKGTQGISLKARLLHISWIKIDGKLEYKYVPKATESSEYLYSKHPKCSMAVCEKECYTVLFTVRSNTLTLLANSLLRFGRESVFKASR